MPTGDTTEARAVYYSALASLEELPTYEERIQVAINWFKEVLVKRANELAGKGSKKDHLEAFNTLVCLAIEDILELPDTYAELLGLDPCSCAKCTSRRLERAGVTVVAVDSVSAMEAFLKSIGAMQKDHN